MKSLEQYMREYNESHRHTGTKLTHMVGIPLIVTSLPIFPFNPLVAGTMFVGGWILQFIGHYVFEKNDPKFFGDPLNLGVGVIWAIVEWFKLVGINLPVPGVEHT
jgi:uncharacterized membrane protein YGL010W